MLELPPDPTVRVKLLTWNIGKRLIPADNIIIDVETDRTQLCVIGFYMQGSGKIHQLVFEKTVDSKSFRESNFFKFLIPERYTVYAYYCLHEIKLFNLDPERVKELQPFPRVSKEQFIKIASLTRASARHLPHYDGSEETRYQYCQHNISCIYKEIILLMDKIQDDNCLKFTRPDFAERFRREFFNAIN